jgi:hypothetical protein
MHVADPPMNDLLEIATLKQSFFILLTFLAFCFCHSPSNCHTRRNMPFL